MRLSIRWRGGAPHAAFRGTAGRAALVAALWLGLGLQSCTPRIQPGGPLGLPGSSFVADPLRAHYGATYAEWSEQWWHWAGEHPVTNHPLYDTTGEHALEWQTDPVWFIGGIFGSTFQPSTGSATRNITIPSRVALFFPVINGEWDNQSCVPPDWQPRSLTDLRELAFSTISGVQGVYCELDGDKIIDSPDLSGAIRYRAMADGFPLFMPDDNIGVGSCGDAPGAKVVWPTASDGIWMMIDPMPPGGHTLRFGGSLPVLGGGFFHLDITYHITVLP